MNKIAIFLAIIIAVGAYVYTQYPNVTMQLLEKVYALVPVPHKQATPKDLAQALPATEKGSIVTLLNKALADEWLAYYQYWIGAYVTTGPLTPKIKGELNEHAEEELKHANWLTARIIELGGTPLLHPEEWFKQTVCGYKAPTDPQGRVVVQQNIESEQCAIKAYNHILSVVETKDPVTHAMVTLILADEVKHEKDLKEILVQF